MVRYCYLNGRFVAVNKAQVSVFDLGLLRGFAVFDFLRAYNGQLFMIDEHLMRLEKSARQLNLKIPYTKKEIKNIIARLLQKNKLKEAGIRIVITGGKSEDGISYNFHSPTFFILAHTPPSNLSAMYQVGAKLITYEHQREVPQAKTTNYLTLLKLQNLKKKNDAAEILYIAGGCILEGATSNFFIFKGDTLITPKDNILFGTRRKLVLELARSKFDIEERPIKLEEMNEATEAFITSSFRDILPVVKIDNTKISNGKVGQNTKKLMNIFNQYVKEYCANSHNE